ncbi:acyltransferase [Dermatophilus congolensis]|uniref:Maltose O-acetyltransferase n=1 Tax=Dermatophilus congolensis TaxID=1863 RepID=A0AA46H0U2_9MICO|nr:acyltransferase [Dermatophilus congolensis]MBO3143282.1 acyltransferase [Dermatophilus congolensis]MBO3152269.1 acyltransferase [Dermatophilus congolensis]MBO3160719.1 acyltransferase [Dermatophilus congolensis]MBO3163557.1 acyltransferase [Dermatophilus congolensis]MBO3177103.1 acyltransferase [Dermatophilus congolensis]
MTTQSVPAPDHDPTIYPEGLQRTAHTRTPGCLRNRIIALGTHIAWNFWVNCLSASPLVPGRLRRIMLNKAGMNINTNGISPHCRFTNSNVYVGRYTYINEGFYADARGGIHIGERVGIGPRVMIITSTHKIGPAEQRTGSHTTRKVIIGDGAAIASGAQIHAGVRMGRGSIASAGAVLMRPCRNGAVVSGVPAKEIYNYND